MEAIKQDWLIRLYYDEEYIETRTTQKDILLVDKTKNDLNEKIKVIKRYYTNTPPDRSYGDESNYTLKKIKVYRIKKDLIKLLNIN